MSKLELVLTLVAAIALPAVAALPSDLTLSSPAFKNGDPIPEQFTADGSGMSPPLQWSGVPDGARELVVLADDPDAARTKGTGETATHWVIYGISPERKGLPEKIPPEPKVAAPVAASQGKNLEGSDGYAPPDPPVGDVGHHYHFKLYALDRWLKLKPGLSESQVRSAIRGHVLAETELVGVYQKNPPQSGGGHL